MMTVDELEDIILHLKRNNERLLEASRQMLECIRMDPSCHTHCAYSDLCMGEDGKVDRRECQFVYLMSRCRY